MKACLVVLIVAMLSGFVQVTPSKTYALSLTPVRPERISRQDTRELCPAGTRVRGTPHVCLRAELQRGTQQMNRSLKRLQRNLQKQLDQQRR